MTSTVTIHLDRLTHNMHLLQTLAGEQALWPAVKANAYGHGAVMVAHHLVGLGYTTLCVAHAREAEELADAGVAATFVLLSAATPHEAPDIAAAGFEPAVCTLEMADALSHAAVNQERGVAIHVKVDTGMGRTGIRPDELQGFLEHCRELPGIFVRGVMSHFPRADEADKSYSVMQARRFHVAVETARTFGEPVAHMANSAAIFDIPDSRFDAARPGISIYGLRPSDEIQNARVEALHPVLEWTAPITFLKSVPKGTGISYGHTFVTERDSVIATIPVGYGDGLHRTLSNRMEMLVNGKRCRQVGRITMDQTMIDVTGVANVKLGDTATIIGRQGCEEVTADDLARTLGTINYEIVTAILPRVRRVAVGG
ncbi:MAG: alanine racemase [Alphaproteobacteria bacterium]|nr:alanine racemase [Alphaproteobacteria bacterium]